MVQFNYSPPLKEYSVMVGAEIPLMRCDTERYKQASHSLIPTFEIPLMSAFIINTEKAITQTHAALNTLKITSSTVKL